MYSSYIVCLFWNVFFTYCLILYYKQWRGQIQIKNTELFCYYTITRHCSLSVQVIQRRVDDKMDFNRDWESYKEGFGDPWRNFWLGEYMQFISCASNNGQIILSFNMF